jgi:hypothetical protein
LLLSWLIDWFMCVLHVEYSFCLSFLVLE